MPENPEPTPEEPATPPAATGSGATTPSAADGPGAGPAGGSTAGDGTSGGGAPDPDADEPRRTKLQIALISAGSALLVALIGLAGAFVARGGGGGGDADAKPPGPTTPIVTTAPTTPPAPTTTATDSPSPTPTRGDTPCVPLKKAHGFSAGFVFPCTGDTLASMYPQIVLRAATYPEEKGEGQLWVVIRVLSDGKGMPLADKPMYAASPVDPGHARKVSATTWTKDIQIGSHCSDYGPAQILTYWLSDSGARQAASWAPGVPITVPPGSVQLDEVTVNMQAGAC
ncbi:hypothetical protein [Actinacidiphila epipremni]|uniref:Uncharacterized protein n=1 Tax=Actinacidiphila epipremni TaxID=2053013 RepID=A0ABX0ZTM1_9ACTN|nr:hypothetical protein [Actinacidiphila epipremni]NJP44968.1 hypothetical protein [Actinacidiphila epipremni]